MGAVDGPFFLRTMRILRLDGQTFGRLTVLERAGKRGEYSLWRCRCKCGKTVLRLARHLKGRKDPSCGCAPNHHKTHGHSRHPTYQSWRAMIRRCYDETHPNYVNYGKIGIWVCESWLTFENFLRDMGPRPPGTTIDRADPECGYDPMNCVWSSPLVQANNRRGSLPPLTYKGRTLYLSEWSRETGLSMKTLRRRVKAGWTTEQILTTKKGAHDGRKPETRTLA